MGFICGPCSTPSACPIWSSTIQKMSARFRGATITPAPSRVRWRCCSPEICCGGSILVEAIDEIPRRLSYSRQASSRRDHSHIGGQFRPGLVGCHARLRGNILPRCLDELVDDVLVGTGAGAARTKDLGL